MAFLLLPVDKEKWCFLRPIFLPTLTVDLTRPLQVSPDGGAPHEIQQMGRSGKVRGGKSWWR